MFYAHELFMWKTPLLPILKKPGFIARLAEGMQLFSIIKGENYREFFKLIVFELPVRGFVESRMDVFDDFSALGPVRPLVLENVNRSKRRSTNRLRIHGDRLFG